jgi:hypothetical protein
MGQLRDRMDADHALGGYAASTRKIDPGVRETVRQVPHALAHNRQGRSSLMGAQGFRRVMVT